MVIIIEKEIIKHNCMREYRREYQYRLMTCVRHRIHVKCEVLDLVLHSNMTAL